MKRFSLFLVAVVLAACGGKDPVSPEDERDLAFADLREAVIEIITDEERQQTALGLVDSFEEEVDSLTELLVHRRAEIRRLNADYDTPRDEFLRFANDMEVRIDENRRRAIGYRAKAIAVTTAEEWDALTKVETKAMKAIAKSVQGI